MTQQNPASPTPTATIDYDDDQGPSAAPILVPGDMDFHELCAAADIEVREDFDPCAHWAPALSTGPDGKFTATFNSPDTLTRYRVIAVAHEGGPVRGFSEMMPAFRGALTEAQLGRVMAYIRTLCTDASWPRGELNLPRALVTEKAFPEDEVVYTLGINTSGAGGVLNAATPPTAGLSLTTVRPGQYFSIRVDDGITKRIEIDTDDSLGFLSFKINRALGTGGTATIVKGSNESALKIKALDSSKV